MRYGLVALLAGLTLLGGCALNGDFGRVRSSLESDDMHA
jgi:energy-converting hydrogenase Eha subunit H